MTALLSWMPLDIARDLGLTLLHFLWQGLLLAALLYAALPACRGAVARHNCALVTLAMMALAPVATFLFLHDFGTSGVAISAAASAPASFAPWTDMLVVLWLAGIAGLSLRALVGWHLVRSLGRRDTQPLPADLLHRCQNLQRRLAVTWPVRFALSHRVQVPMVIGLLRPVILIPVSALVGLPPHQLDALILHELAHIRRFDTITNMALVAVETVLFYHPAVWWVSRQVRIEREHACDDFAVSACGDAALYVEALATLEEGRIASGLALAASGGKLKDRVARLLGASADVPRYSLSAIAGLALLSLVMGSVAIAQTATRPSQDAGAYPSKDKSPVSLRPVRETRSLPPYPTESVKLHEEGRVLLEVAIGTDGAVSQARVFKPSGHQLLDDVALWHVQKYWRWHPPMRGGKPVKATTRVAVDFKLQPKGFVPPAPPSKM